MKIPSGNSCQYALLLLLLGGACWSSQAADWSSTDIQLLHGRHYELSNDEDQTIMTLEHASGGGYGDMFIFVDITNPGGGGRDQMQWYGEVQPRFSFSKIFHHPFSGFVKDLLLATQLNMGHSTDYNAKTGATKGSSVSAQLYGLGIDFDIPGARFFQLNMYHRSEHDEFSNGGFAVDDGTTQITIAGLYPFHIAGTQWSIGGFVDHIGAIGNGVANTLSQPQLLLDIGSLWGWHEGILEAGVEYQYFHNKFGIDGVDERVWQAMIKWTL